MKYDMLALDIDGTLTNSQKRITESTKSAIFEAQEHGTTIVLASGRPTPGCEALVKELRLDTEGGYLLSFNGANITDCRTNEIVFQQTLARDLVPQLYAYALKFDLGMMTYKGRDILTGTEIDRFMQLEARINNMPIQKHADFLSQVPPCVNKCLLTGEPEVLAFHEKILAERFGHEASVYRSEPFFLEIMPAGIDKANSLSVLLEKTGIPREALVCCGDGYNDISMIRFAGLGVAMHNAQPQVKAVADYITESNDRDGVARVIRAFICRLTKNVA